MSDGGYSSDEFEADGASSPSKLLVAAAKEKQTTDASSTLASLATKKRATSPIRVGNETKR